MDRYRVDIKSRLGTYTLTTDLTFEEACAKKERASKKMAFVGREIKVVKCH